MARSAVLAGRTLADLIRNALVIGLMIALGYALGFRPQTSFAPLVGALLVALAFAYALSWVMASIGLGVKNSEAAQSALVGAARRRQAGTDADGSDQRVQTGSRHDHRLANWLNMPPCRRLTVAESDHSDYIGSMKIEEIGTLEAKTNLSALLNQVLEGKSFYLTRRGKRIAELRPVAPPSHSRRAGFAKGTFTFIAPDFDAPLDDFADYR